MKKIIAIILVLMLASTSLAYGNMQTAQNDLTRYGIITDYELETINRGEAAKIIAAMFGAGEIKQADTVFADVPMEYWASGYINYANQSGIIDGNGDGTFLPEEKVTNEQMVKMLVCALGYAPNVRGNYPVAHFVTATDIGITKGLDLVGSNIASRANVAVMVHNALDIPIMVQTSFGEKTQYAVLDGTGNNKYTTLRTKLEENIKENNIIKFYVEKIPSFNGPEYTGALLKVADFEKNDNVITFKNNLNKDDKKTYIIDENTYVYVSNNTLPLSYFENERYVQCWYNIDDEENIHLLKIEIMKEIPSI